MMMTLVTDQGTACAETVLCEVHDTPENRKRAEEIAQEPLFAGDPALSGSWWDCTGNEAVKCLICGRPTPTRRSGPEKRR